MSSKSIKKSGGSSLAKKKMAGGGAPNANGYGKKLVSYPLTGAKASNLVNAAKTKAVAKKTASKPVTKKKVVAKKKAMSDDEFDTYMNKKYGTMTKSDYSKATQNSTIIADTNNPSNVGKTRKEIARGGKDEPIAMIKNEVVKIPISTAPKINRTAMIPVGKKGSAMSKMKKMTYKKGGSKKMC